MLSVAWWVMALDGERSVRSDLRTEPKSVYARPYEPREGDERRYMVELGVRLKRMREERGFTQSVLAQISAVATDMISRLENGHYQSPGLRTLLRLADGLGVEVSELLPAVTPDQRHGREYSQRVRLLALLKRVSAEDLGMVADIVEIIAQRSR